MPRVCTLGCRRALPKAAGIDRPSAQTVNAIETGRYDPSLALAFKIADVFDDRIECLFFPSDEPAPGPEDRRG